MKYGLYIIYNKISETYSEPHMVRTDEGCIRSIVKGAEQGQVDLSELILYKMCDYDIETGFISDVARKELPLLPSRNEPEEPSLSTDLPEYPSAIPEIRALQREKGMVK